MIVTQSGRRSLFAVRSSVFAISFQQAAISFGRVTYVTSLCLPWVYANVSPLFGDFAVPVEVL